MSWEDNEEWQSGVILLEKGVPNNEIELLKLPIGDLKAMSPGIFVN